jgi:DNA-directed RNA polymerase specialized sigma24 family protein
MILHSKFNMKYTEIASATNDKVNNIKSYIRKARKKLERIEN